MHSFKPVSASTFLFSPRRLFKFSLLGLHPPQTATLCKTGNPPPCRRARSGVVASLSFGLPVRWCAGPGFAGLRSAFCRSTIGDPPPRFLYRLRRLHGFFRTCFSCVFRTPSWTPFGPPKTSIVANLDPKMTPKWSPKSKKNQTSSKSEN